MFTSIRNKMCIVSGHVPVGHVSTDDRISCNSSGQSNGSHAIEFGKDYWFSPLLLIPTFTVFGNLLVCLSVWRDRNLQTVTNYFIVSLAVADIMVAILVMPFAVYVEINKNVWELGDALCDTWVAFDVLCCTASILNLTAISVDRFIAVTQPIRYSRHRHNHCRVYVTLGLTWVISVSVSLPIAVGMNYTERRRETPWLCTFYNSDFLIYSSMLSFYIPCLLMIFLYFKTFRAIRQVALKKKQRLQKQKRLCKRKMHKNAEKVALASRLSEGTTDSDLDGASDCGSQKNLMPTRIRKKFAQLRASGRGGTLRKKASESEISSTHSPLMDETELELINRGVMRRVPGNECTCLTTGKGDHVVYESTTPRILEVSEELNPTAGSELQSESKTAGDDGQHVPRTGEDRQLVPLSNFSVVVRLNDENDTAFSCRSELRKNRRFSRVVSLSPPPRLSERGSRRGFTTRERKATKTLAIVLGVFLFCWVPFFTINIVNAICIRYGLFDHAFCNIHQMAFSCFVWLGYFNSFLNPVIYTIFNEEFRKAFKAILLVPCK